MNFTLWIQLTFTFTCGCWSALVSDLQVLASASTLPVSVNSMLITPLSPWRETLCSYSTMCRIILLVSSTCHLIVIRAQGFALMRGLHCSRRITDSNIQLNAGSELLRMTHDLCNYCNYGSRVITFIFYLSIMRAIKLCQNQC
jgi:hypothetical protein